MPAPAVITSAREDFRASAARATAVCTALDCPSEPSLLIALWMGVYRTKSSPSASRRGSLARSDEVAIAGCALRLVASLDRARPQATVRPVGPSVGQFPLTPRTPRR